jgi:hypothetical protein
MTEKFISESQLKQAVREVLLELLGVGIPAQATSPANRQWYDTDPAYQMLGFDHPKQLREAVSSGLLRIGHEVRDRRKPNGKLPRYQFHLEKCQKRLSERPERRKAG